jgi:Ni/Co efflux regulator RcnB
MRNQKLRMRCLALAAALVAAPALADMPDWAGEGKGKGHERKDRDEHRERGDRDDQGRRHFTDDHRGAVRAYYEEEYRGGHCPPGLAKKHDGCLPPGQARKWRMGRAIPAGVVVYDVPPALVVKIGVPPAGYKYVRVASDILMVAVGTSVVVDAIKDLGRM